jgi:hypothetical protein
VSRVSDKLEDGRTDILRLREPGAPMAERHAPTTDELSPPWRLLFQVYGEKRTTLGVTVQERIYNGRATNGLGLIPDVDLTEFDGAENGVSREHALILTDTGLLYIRDLGSTNGTRINGYELEPDRNYRLRDGDELEFGRLRSVIRFVRTSALPSDSDND